MTITDPVELATQRSMTDYFIKADPISVMLIRRARVSNGHGGFTLGMEQMLPAQQFKLIPQSHQLVNKQTIQGVVLVPDHVLLGYYDADIQNNDYFLYEGYRYDVTFVHEKKDFETTAEVQFRGQPG